MPPRLRPWLMAVGVVLALNVVFLLVCFAETLLPRDRLADRVRRAFADGSLVERDYLPYDTRLGWHQYNDCDILQMLTNADSSATGRVLGPWLHLPDTASLNACATLRKLVVDGRSPEGMYSFRYTRYWHGYMPIAGALLSVVDVATARKVLRVLAYASVLALLIAGLRNPTFLPLSGAVSVCALFFWGLPSFGLGLSHAPGDSAVMLGIALLVFWHRRLVRLDVLVPCCAAFGAVVVYFEMLTGPLPIAAGLLFPTAYLISRTARGEASAGEHLRFATGGLVAFAAGATLTVVSRLAVAELAVHPSGLPEFVYNLRHYSVSVGPQHHLPGWLVPMFRLAYRGSVLTYGSAVGMAALYLSALGAWVGAFVVAWKRATRVAWADLLAFVVGAASVPAWCLLLPEHTYEHVFFMVRIMIVPISLGWAALFWQLQQMGAARSDGSPA